MKYDVLIFDADDTLFDFQKSEKYAFKEAILEMNIDYDEAVHHVCYHDINTKIWKEFEEGKITQEKLKIERFRRLKEKLHLDFDENVCAKSYMKHLANGSFLLPDSEEVIKQLVKDYHLILVTNGLKSVQEKRIKQSSLANYFEEIIISEEIGISKPDPRIFEYALRNLTVQKDKVLMIGDSLTSDIKGGNNAGIDTCWYNPFHKENPSHTLPTYEVDQLKDLFDILV